MKNKERPTKNNLRDSVYVRNVDVQGTFISLLQ